MKVYEIERGEYRITTDPSQLDFEACCRMLHSVYWAKTRSRERIRKSFENSIVFGVFCSGEQCGIARVVTDRATFAWLCDVVISEEHRGKGVGKWVVEAILEHPDLQDLRYFLLATRDAHSLYEQYGWTPLPNPARWMIRLDEEAKLAMQ